MSVFSTACGRLDIRNAIANTLLVLLVCAGCGASSVQESDPVIARFKDHLATSDSVYISMTATMSDAYPNPHEIGIHDALIIRATSDPLIAIDQGFNLTRHSFDGQKGRVGTPNTVTEANATTNALILAAWLEIRAGLPNTTFVPESPTVHDPKTPVGILKWYRVDFPFSEFGTRLFYIGFNEKTLEPERVTVFRGPGGAPVELLGSIESPFRIDAIDWNAPIDVNNINTPEAQVVGRSWMRAQGRDSYLTGIDNKFLVAPVAAKRLQLDYVGRRYEQPAWIAGTWTGVQPSLMHLAFDPNFNQSQLNLSNIACTGEPGVWLIPFEYQWRTQPNEPLLEKLPQMLPCPACFMGVSLQSGQVLIEPGTSIGLTLHSEVGQVNGNAYEVLASNDWQETWQSPKYTEINGYAAGGAGGVRSIPGSALAYTGGDIVLKVLGTYAITCEQGSMGRASFSFVTGAPPVIDFRNCPNE